MTSEDALRFLEFEAAYCRTREESEALCLLLPSLLKVFELTPMDGYEAKKFRDELKRALGLCESPHWIGARHR
jgi:hypothetical protein